MWVGRGLDGVEEAHVADVVEVDLLFEDDDETLAVKSYGEDGGGEGELADGGLSLARTVSLWTSWKALCGGNLGVCDLKPPR